MRFELKLVDIHLKNFRLFEDIKVNFDENLTVLIGENGAGKTALLEGVAKALNVFTEKMKTALTNVDFKSVYSDSDIRYRQTETITEIEVKFLETEKLEAPENSVAYLSKKLSNSNSEEKIKDIDAQLEILNERFRNEPDEIKAIELNDQMGYLLNLKSHLLDNNEDSLDSSGDSKELDSWQNIQWEINQTKANAQINKFSELKELDRLANHVHEANRNDESLSLPVIVYYTSTRLSENNTNGQEHDEVFNAYDDALNGNSINFKWLLDWFVFKEDNIETSERLLNAVKEAIFLVLNDDDAVFKEIKTDRTRRKDYRLIVQKGNDKVEVNQLSSGEKSLLVLVSDLARRLALANPISNDPLKEGQGIVLIDEIDLHLHPRWQRAVIPKLQRIFPKIQWVITTHSPLVLTHSTNGKAIRLNNGTLTEYKQYRGMRLMDIFYDLYDTESRPKDIQIKIDLLFEEIEAENWTNAHARLNELKEILPENDPAIIEAQTTLDLIEI